MYNKKPSLWLSLYLFIIKIRWQRLTTWCPGWTPRFHLFRGTSVWFLPVTTHCHHFRDFQWNKKIYSLCDVVMWWWTIGISIVWCCSLMRVLSTSVSCPQHTPNQHIPKVTYRDVYIYMYIYIYILYLHTHTHTHTYTHTSNGHSLTNQVEFLSLLLFEELIESVLFLSTTVL